MSFNNINSFPQDLRPIIMSISKYCEVLQDINKDPFDYIQRSFTFVQDEIKIGSQKFINLNKNNQNIITRIEKNRDLMFTEIDRIFEECLNNTENFLFTSLERFLLEFNQDLENALKIESRSDTRIKLLTMLKNIIAKQMHEVKKASL